MSEPCRHSAGFLGSKFQRVFKNITNPERPELGRSVNGRGSSSTGLFVGFDRREVLWAFVNKWKLTRWLILHKPLAEGNVVFRYFYL